MNIRIAKKILKRKGKCKYSEAQLARASALVRKIQESQK